MKKTNEILTKMDPEFVANAIADKVDFGMYLRLFRTARGLSIIDLAGKAGICQKTVSTLENGKQMPTKRSFSKLMEALEAPPEHVQAFSYLAGKALMEK